MSSLPPRAGKIRLDRLPSPFLAVLTLLLVGFVAGCPRSGQIEVWSVPSGAAVLLDGLETGDTTNCSLKNVGAGGHELGLRLEGFVDYDTTVIVTAGGKTEVAVTLVSVISTGSIEVWSVPSGASVFLDSSDAGQKTDCVLTSVAAGNHDVGLELAGYVDFDTSVVVKAGETTRVSASLSPALMTWSKTFGGDGNDYGKAGGPTTDGGYMAFADKNKVTGGNEADVWLVKVDRAGNLVWDRTLGRSSSVRAGEQTQDGGYLVLAAGASGGSRLVKTDASGNSLWERTFDGDPRQVRQTADGGYVIVGTESGDAWLLKADASGNQQWEVTFGGSAAERGRGLDLTTDGGYIVLAGISTSDAWLIRTDANGTKLWEKTFPTNDPDWGIEPETVRRTADGGYILLATDGGDARVLKTDAGGSLVWSKEFDRGGWDELHDVEQTTDGGYILAGESDDIWLLKLNSTGGRLWEKYFGGAGADAAHTVRQTSDGGYILVGYLGYVYDPLNPEDAQVILVKTDANGNVSGLTSGKR